MSNNIVSLAKIKTSTMEILKVYANLTVVKKICMFPIFQSCPILTLLAFLMRNVSELDDIFLSLHNIKFNEEESLQIF